jgi:hypothetical protein
MFDRSFVIFILFLAVIIAYRLWKGPAKNAAHGANSASSDGDGIAGGFDGGHGGDCGGGDGGACH